MQVLEGTGIINIWDHQLVEAVQLTYVAATQQHSAHQNGEDSATLGSHLAGSAAKAAALRLEGLLL